jgi:hypothetical protein
LRRMVRVKRPLMNWQRSFCAGHGCDFVIVLVLKDVFWGNNREPKFRAAESAVSTAIY